MEIREAELVVSAPSKAHWPESELPEDPGAAGRSNVGKSSLINTLCGRKALAYVGNTPGKTRLLNFFNIDHRFMFVDVPGYGFANASKQMLIQFCEKTDGGLFLQPAAVKRSDSFSRYAACADGGRYHNGRLCPLL